MNHVLQKSDRNGSHQRDRVALFRVQLKHDCVQAIQVDLVSSANQ
jgi:advillin